MMVPVPFVLWSLGIAFLMFCLLLAFKAVAGGPKGRAGQGMEPQCGAALLARPASRCARLPSTVPPTVSSCHARCAERRLGRPLSFGSSGGEDDAGLHPHHQLLHGADDDEPGPNGFGGSGYGNGAMHGGKHGRADRDVELSGLVLKTYAADHAA